jgi:hypothetical protein
MTIRRDLEAKLLAIHDLASARLKNVEADGPPFMPYLLHDLREIVRISGPTEVPTWASMSTPPPVDWSAKTTLHGSDPNADDHKAIDSSTGMQKDYVVLSAAERAKGFVRPVRRSYVHVGKRPKHALRELDASEAHLSASEGFTKFEVYPEGGGRFWTAAELTSGCGGTTTMGQALAETYAREPGFYGGTFCATCRAHFPVGEDGEFVWAGTAERVGT